MAKGPGPTTVTPAHHALKELIQFFPETKNYLNKVRPLAARRPGSPLGHLL